MKCDDNNSCCGGNMDVRNSPFLKLCLLIIIIMSLISAVLFAYNKMTADKKDEKQSHNKFGNESHKIITLN